MKAKEAGKPGTYVGIADLPNQVYRRVVKQGFKLNLMMLGRSGLGKRTFINSLFGVNVFNIDEQHTDTPIREQLSVEKEAFQIETQGVRVLVNVLTVPGFGDQIDNSTAHQVLTKYIDAQFQDYFEASHQRKSQSRRVDNRVFCCLYFIAPTGHLLPPLDVLMMKSLGSRTNLIPLVAKADTLTVDERQAFRDLIRSQLIEHEIQFYIFPSDEDSEGDTSSRDSDFMRNLAPFAVVGSNTVITGKDGYAARVRQYPWGTVDIEGSECSDMAILRRLLLFSHLPDLVSVTDGLHYANYVRQIVNVSKVGPPSSLVKSPTKFSSPVNMAEADCQDVEACIVKMKEGFQTLYDRKMWEKNDKLQLLMNDMEERYVAWQDEFQCKKARLEADGKEYERQLLLMTHSYPQLTDRMKIERLKHPDSDRCS